jgi:molybdopterin-containing oxidoreductase family iron-sulfur binding subunit
LAKADGEHEFAVFKVKNVNGREISSKKPLEIFNTKDAHVWNEQPMVSLIQRS